MISSLNQAILCVGLYRFSRYLYRVITGKEIIAMQVYTKVVIIVYSFNSEYQHNIKILIHVV